MCCRYDHYVEIRDIKTIRYLISSLARSRKNVACHLMLVGRNSALEAASARPGPEGCGAYLRLLQKGVRLRRKLGPGVEFPGLLGRGGGQVMAAVGLEEITTARRLEAEVGRIPSLYSHCKEIMA